MVAMDNLLQNFEELFQSRYTEHDKDYFSAVQSGQRSMVSVPVMTPWPKYVRGRGNRYNMYGGSSRGRHDRGSSNRNSRYNDWEPSEYHYHRNDHRSSDFDYSNDHRSVPSSYDDTSFRTNQDDVHHDDHPPPSSEPTQQQHTVPQDTNEYEHQPLRNALDSFKESPSKPPSDSDFNAILNTAHDSNVIASKSNNLTKEKFLRTVKMKKRPKLSSEKDSTQNPSKSKSLKSKIPLKSSSKGDSNVLNRHAPHGLTESASHILSAELKTGIIRQDRKRKHSVIDEQRSDSENEQVDIESYYEHEMTTNSPSVNSSSGNTSSAVGKQPFYASTGADNDESSTSLVVSLPLHSTKPKIDEVDHIIEENTMMQSTDQKKRKKHHRQRKKKHALQDKDSSKTDKPLTLKISVKREND